WTALGGGTRIPGGWQRTGLSLPTNITIRARGYALAGSGSSWFAETVLRAPLVISESHVSTNGHTQFTASGPVGQIVVIEGSPDLKTWTPLQTITLGTDPSFFTDPQPALLSMRF